MWAWAQRRHTRQERPGVNPLEFRRKIIRAAAMVIGNLPNDRRGFG
jgi:hypothetical protein